MEPMQDKDFDQLFKQRFETFEVEPSDRSWGNITGQLDGQNKRRKAFPSYWMAAASLVIMTSAVLWLYRPAEVIKLRGKAGAQVAVNQKPAVIELEPLNSETVEGDAEQQDPVEPVRRGKILLSQEQAHQSMNRPVQNEGSDPEKADLMQNEVILASQPQVAAEIPRSEIKMEERALVFAQNAPVTEVTDEPGQGPGRQRIKGVGGLVNFVIAQVDKRDNKIIEFKDGEEGTEVSGINLGPIKFKSRNK
jgi:hypothetical protein